MRRYPWKRYWCRPTDPVLLDSNGFVLDPEQWPNGAAIRLESLEANPCLILLGEPGIGKTTTLETEYDRLAAGGPHIATLWVDLRRYGDESRLVQSITQAKSWKAWLRGEVDLHLFFDSLDEGRLRISNVGEVLIDTLKDLPLQRLFLRVACRTADWPATLQDELVMLYRHKRPESTEPVLLELVTLRLDDVRLAASLEGLNPDTFLDHVIDKGAGPLAAKPATLGLLLKLANKGDFPARQIELYELGCLELCEDPNPKRREVASVDSRFRLPNPRETLATASRIAAVTLLCNRHAVHQGKQSDAEDGDITLHELIGGNEPITDSDSDSLAIEQKQVRQALQSGLFTSRGRDRLGWAHQTYAEYLAARYLQAAPLPQIQSLLAHPEAGRLIPQLHQTASWLASMRPDVFQWMIAIDPAVLLRSDVATADPPAKAQLIEQLLQAFQTDRLLGTMQIRSMFYKLRYPGIASQLRPYIATKEQPAIVREVAMEMGADAGATDLAELYADIALDPSEPYPIRCDAAWGVVKLGDAATKKRLEPLALGLAGEDPDDRLRGLGLRCVWPYHWTTAELLPRLVRPRRDDLIGAYQIFLRDHVVAHIGDHDVPQALDVACTWADSRHGTRKDILHGLVQRAIQLQNDPRVTPALARAVVAHLNRHYELPGGLSAALNENVQARLNLLQAIVAEEPSSRRDLFRLVSTGIVRPADVMWVLDRLQEAPVGDQSAWLELIDLILRAEDSPTWSDRLVDLCQHVPALQEKVAWLFHVWPLNAPKSRKAKARHLKEVRWQRRMAGKPLDPSPRERLELALKRVEAGEPECWLNVCISLALEPASSHYHFPSDLEKTPGWPVLDPESRKRITVAARTYLVERPPGPPHWIAKNEIPWDVLAGYLAFRVLARDGNLAAVPLVTWARWVPALVATPIESPDELHNELIRATYARIPEAVVDCVQLLVAADSTYALHHLDACWDERLNAVVLDCLQRCVLTPRARILLTERLTERGHQPTLDWLVAEAVRLTNSPTDIPWLLHCSSLALVFGGDSPWPVIKDLLVSRVDLGRPLLLEVTQRSSWHKVPFPANLSEQALGELLAFMINWFPPETDPKIRGSHAVTAREEAGRLRETLLGHLSSKGTRAACDSMKTLLTAFPARASYLKWYLHETEEVTRRKTWSPPASRYLLSLLQHHKRRYVETEDQLLEAIVSALQELEENLHGQWTPVQLLWNDRPLAPKDEHAVCDFLAERLADELGQKGVIVNREVQIKRGAGVGPAKVPGERTDLHIQAIARGPANDRAHILTVVVEVKGCWHHDVLDAMRSQLCDRYLRGNGFTHGVYVVAWFLCDAWVRDDRKSRTPHKTVDEARTFFEQQAKQLVTDDPAVQVRAIMLDLSLGRGR